MRTPGITIRVSRHRGRRAFRSLPPLSGGSDRARAAARRATDVVAAAPRPSRRGATAIGSLALLGLLIAAAAYLWWRNRDDDDDGDWDRAEPEPPVERGLPASESKDEQPTWAATRANGEREAVTAGGGPSIAGVGEPAAPRSFPFRVPWGGSPLPVTEPQRPPT